jgi:hypothetical protein
MPTETSTAQVTLAKTIEHVDEPKQRSQHMYVQAKQVVAGKRAIDSGDENPLARTLGGLVPAHRVHTEKSPR